MARESTLSSSKFIGNRLTSLHTRGKHLQFPLGNLAAPPRPDFPPLLFLHAAPAVQGFLARLVYLPERLLSVPDTS